MSNPYAPPQTAPEKDIFPKWLAWLVCLLPLNILAGFCILVLWHQIDVEAEWVVPPIVSMVVVFIVSGFGTLILAFLITPRPRHGPKSGEQK